MNNSFTWLGKFKPVKQEVSHTVILPPTVSVQFSDLSFIIMTTNCICNIQFISAEERVERDQTNYVEEPRHRIHHNFVTLVSLDTFVLLFESLHLTI